MEEQSVQADNQDIGSLNSAYISLGILTIMIINLTNTPLVASTLNNTPAMVAAGRCRATRRQRCSAPSYDLVVK